MKIPVTPILMLSVLGIAACASAQGTAFTYQGRLDDNGVAANGSYDLRFILYTADVGGSQIGPTLTNAPVPVSGGLFTVTLDFGTSVFTGPPRWLEIGVRTNGSVSLHTPLSPRQSFTPTPYAITAGNVSGGGLMGTYSNAVTFNNAANSFTGSGAGLSGVNAATLGGLAAGAFWQLGGNAGTTPGVNFLGTTDSQPLELRANNQRVLRLEPGNLTVVVETNTVFYSNAPNVIAGASLNRTEPGVLGAVIGGGGVDGIYLNNAFLFSWTNYISAHFATIGGGAANTIQTNSTAATISGGDFNTIQSDSTRATISGGAHNTIETNAFEATIAGGTANRIRYDAFRATIGGGGANNILPGIIYATIGGGDRNHAGGPYATVPGGSQNHAFGSYSLAAGRHARANHDGDFVWADSQVNEFNSTAPNQFLIRASGGVGIGTSSPRHQLRISGGPLWTSAGWQGAVELDNGSAIGWNANASGNRFGIGQSGGGLYFFASASDPGNTANPANYVMTISDGANVGIRTITPGYTLTVNGNAGKLGGGSWSDSSDTRIKKNIQPLTGALDKLTQLRGVSFEWINPADHANQTGRQAGFVAQEVERVFPNWVQEVPGAEHDACLTPEGRVKSLTLPFEFDALTLEALRELRAEKDSAIERLSQQLADELKRRDAENAELKKSVAELRELVSKLAAQQNGGAR